MKACADLERRLGSEDRYEILNCSRLLRQLLFDSEPLVHAVNKEYRLKIRFEITEFSLSRDPPPEFWAIVDFLDPETAGPEARKVVVSLNRFLGTVILVSGGREFTVRDLIAFEAHIMGGVHAGLPSEAQRAVLQIERVYLGRLPASLQQIKTIARVVLRGIQPLREKAQGGPLASIIDRLFENGKRNDGPKP